MEESWPPYDCYFLVKNMLKLLNTGYRWVSRRVGVYSAQWSMLESFPCTLKYCAFVW